jgi:HD superfamily phosphodiesterase
MLTKPTHQKIFEKAQPFLQTRKNLIHTRIALRCALKLLQSEKGDKDVVIPAVLLHDIGWKMVPESLHLTAFGPNASNCKLTKVHEVEGAKIAEAILKKFRYPPRKINEICHIIRGHDTRKKPLSRNDRIVKDADKLWRYSRRGMAIDLARFQIPYREYLVFLERAIDQWFLTPTGKRIAKKEIFLRAHEAEEIMNPVSLHMKKRFEQKEPSFLRKRNDLLP